MVVLFVLLLAVNFAFILRVADLAIQDKPSTDDPDSIKVKYLQAALDLLPDGVMVLEERK